MKKLLQHLNLLPSKTDIKALIISYIFINFAFLYHSLNFMWGNHDVEFIKTQTHLSSGLFEGRFTQFIPHWLLTNGQILPILNNLLGFLFLALGLWLLAKYWNIEKSTHIYALFITLFATEPYTLSWLYFTFLTISCFLWVLLAILGLFLSELIHKNNHKWLLSTSAILCFYLPLGGYPPIINTFFVCLSAKLLLSYVFENKDLKTLFNIHKYTILNIFIAALLFKMTLRIINPDNVYNLQTTSTSDFPYKLFQTLKISINQFFISLPFMSKPYKLFLATLTTIAFLLTLMTAKNIKSFFIILGLICVTVLSTTLTTLIATAPTQYVTRIDFYGLAFIYILVFTLLISQKTPVLKTVGIIYAIITIFLSTLNDFHAQKIWKQGFDAEFQILEQVNERIENHPQFNSKQKYRFLQIGDISLRPSYYKQKYDMEEPFLLSLPYLAIWQGASLIEYYSPFSFIKQTPIIMPGDITPEVSRFLKKEAHPWPHQNAVYITKDIIFVIYNQNELDNFKKKIQEL